VYFANYLIFILGAFGFVAVIIGAMFVYSTLYDALYLDDIYQAIIAIAAGFVILAALLVTFTSLYKDNGVLNVLHQIVDVQTRVLNGKDLRIGWNVTDGIGCCATYNCYKSQFFADCVYPEFTLFDIALDGVNFNWHSINTSNWNYTCDFVTPWNYFTFYNVTPGEHNVTIYQKDCHTQIIDIKELKVTV
jgi:hypothetical protein